jgi:hypothetical protein
VKIRSNALSAASGIGLYASPNLRLDASGFPWVDPVGCLGGGSPPMAKTSVIKEPSVFCAVGPELAAVIRAQPDDNGGLELRVVIYEKVPR